MRFLQYLSSQVGYDLYEENLEPVSLEELVGAGAGGFAAPVDAPTYAAPAAEPFVSADGMSPGSGAGTHADGAGLIDWVRGLSEREVRELLKELSELRQEHPKEATILMLAVVGMLPDPFIGVAADVIAALILAADGDWEGVAVSVAAFVVAAGAFAGAAQIVRMARRMLSTPGAVARYPKLAGLVEFLEKWLGTSSALSREQLLAELRRSGIKHSPENVIAIGRDSSWRIVFLEKGNASAGLQHIVDRHAAEFAQRGIPESQIPDVVMKAVTEGRQVGVQGAGTGRPIYEVVVNGQTQRIAVTVGDNGFIVGANPK